MPFAFRLKKVRRYDVATRALFVLSVQLLDNTEMECTLNEASTGEELLSHIAQRLNIREYGYFGLKFINKHLQYQWLALDLPLKRQLTKFAHSLFVKFSVRFYVKNATQLKDESTRYQFFLQLRNEIIEGALLCSPEQAVLLASYSLQAAYGDFDPERHAPHHLKDFFLLPKRMCTQEEILMELLREVSNTHRSFHGMSPAAAEMFYIQEAQSLEGYGEEYYAAKDASGNDLLLGTSHLGVTIKHPTGRPLLNMAWPLLKNVSRAKRSIYLECVGTGRTNQRMVQIFLENADFAAYVLTNISLQQDFYLTEAGANGYVGNGSSFPVTGNGGPVDPGPHPQAHPFRLMFRPDATGMTRPLSNGNTSNGVQVQTVVRPEQHPAPASSQPDVIDFARTTDLYMPRDHRAHPGEHFERAAPPLSYREAPAYDSVIKNHPVDLLHRTPGAPPLHRYSWIDGMMPEGAPAEIRGIHAQSSIIGPLINSTPELRSTGAARRAAALSCSTPDLLSMTGPVPARRVLISRPERSEVFVSHSQELPVVRQTAADELTVTPLKHFDAVLEEEVSVSPADSKHVPSLASDDPEVGGSPHRPLLLAAMNGLVLSNVCLAELPPDHAIYENLSPKDARRADLEKRLSSGSVLIEFEQIPKKRRTNAVCNVARMPENAERNRYPDVLPYDDTRIQLRRFGKNNTKAYINASQIVLECGDLERQYIATQDPMPSTTEDLLNMLWDDHVRIAVVLSDATTVPWITHLTKADAQLGAFTLRRETITSSSGYRTLTFSLSNKQEKGTKRKMLALHYEAWAEQGIPADVDGFIQMVRELESYRRQFQGSVREKVAVICKTGCGRSGVLILLDFMALCVDHNQAVDVPRVLAHMRRQRMFMVQTVAQYRFVYAALVRHLNSSRLI
ncbi:tyrosine-protein phosphatase non-receptor type 21-like [Paramacrobiotus metropolitanus]|uniref:tyrosine-protein phosphatase non-receptor type 21-like n=1 Tax=Paramacrobiotus metropolitanus TaxID=2943436 RepID=UPI00244580EA|nr:tyrosine-protein phosphatase non-receptor type 21-like [Paramacrobiotus metropolitanus]